jgi:hypothetical protein
MCARTRQRPGTALALVVVLVLTGTARAEFLTYTSSYSITNGTTFTSLTPPNGGFSGSPPYLFAVGEGVHANVSLPRFDPALGTLTGITFTLGATLQHGTGELWVVPFVPPNSQVFMLNEVRAVGPTGQLVSTGGSRTVLAPPPGVYQHSILIPSPDATAAYTDPGTLASYSGPGTFSVDVFKHLATGGNPGTFVHTRLTSPGTAAGSLAVIYEFEPVPVPAAWMLLGIGMTCTLLPLAARKGGRGRVAPPSAAG